MRESSNLFKECILFTESQSILSCKGPTQGSASSTPKRMAQYKYQTWNHSIISPMVWPAELILIATLISVYYQSFLHDLYLFKIILLK